ncbi:MAG: respiratory nitrate reductase subunit gamma [Pseudomonadota bacterium]
MLDAFFLIGLPYVALVILIVGSIYRYRSDQFSYSALSSQFLESKMLLVGTVPWHAGILVIFLGHFLVLFFPSYCHRLISNPDLLIAVESLGMACTLLAIVGLVFLIVRRIINSKVQAVTSTMDLLILFLFLFQAFFGLSLAIGYRWGSAWASGTLAPYIWSILTLHPDMTYVSDMPGLVKIHLILAYLIFLFIPFSRLVHIFSFPFDYFFRPHQNVVWARIFASKRSDSPCNLAAERRHFMRTVLGIAAGTGLIGTGSLVTIFKFLKGPELTIKEEEELLETKLKRYEQTSEEKKLELERMRNDSIFVAKVSELQTNKGVYFIDYRMAPALAFLGANSLPILISAKCTHLGCTVGNDMDTNGNILCPCHISYFNVKTGVPNPGAPAKLPLRFIGWVLKDNDGKIILSQGPDGGLIGQIPTDANVIKNSNLYIAKEFEKVRA